MERMEEIAKDVGAPNYKKIESFFVNMRLKHQEDTSKGGEGAEQAFRSALTSAGETKLEI